VPTYDASVLPHAICRKEDTGCADDLNGHGTHCAGIAGGTSYGVAKNVTLHAVKVLADTGSGWWSWYLSALDWVIVNGLRPAVVSASIGGRGVSKSLRDGITKTVEAGIMVVVSAGNLDIDACGYTPAFVPAAITVGSTTILDARSWFSNYGSCLDVFAPGSAIVSCGIENDTASDTKSGTSMACPHVAGAAALILSQDPKRSPEDVEKLLTSQATIGKLTDVGSASPNSLLYITAAPVMPSDGPAPEPTPNPAPAPDGKCCYWGSGCRDPARSCTSDAWCGQTEDHCMSYCNGLFYCSG